MQSQEQFIERYGLYIGGILAYQGQDGSKVTFDAAHAAKGFNLGELGYPTFQRWNETNAFPPWNESDLRRKFTEAMNSRKAPGWLADGPQGGGWIAPSSAVYIPTPTIDEELEAEEKRKKWPAFRDGSEMELRQVAKLRGIHPGIAYAAQKQGVLRFGNYLGRACYIMTCEKQAQARALSGEKLPNAKGELVKSLNLPGGRGSWIGYDLLGKHRSNPVLVTEGGISYLEGPQAITESRFQSFLPFASFTSQSKLGERELSLLKGREVILAMDADKAGAEAVTRWEISLLTVGVKARIWTPPTPAKDLGEALQQSDFDVNTIFSL